MSYRKMLQGRLYKGLVCDGCEAPLREGDPSVYSVQVMGLTSRNGSRFELCALCRSKERADATTLGKFFDQHESAFGENARRKAGRS